MCVFFLFVCFCFVLFCFCFVFVFLGGDRERGRTVSSLFSVFVDLSDVTGHVADCVSVCCLLLFPHAIRYLCH